MVLRVIGCDVRLAHNGFAALEAAAGFRPEVIFLDIGLPGMDGYEVARRVRQTEGTRSALLVAITGYGQDEDRRRSHEAGFDRHLVKPVDFEDLKTLVRMAPAAAGPSV
jgi:CheY-like chemotaxis protein